MMRDGSETQSGEDMVKDGSEKQYSEVMVKCCSEKERRPCLNHGE